MAGIIDWIRRGAADADMPELTDVPTSAVTPVEPEPAAPRSSLMRVQAVPDPPQRPIDDPLAARRPSTFFGPLTTQTPQVPERERFVPDRMKPAPTDEPTMPDVPLRQSTWRKDPKWIDVPGKGWVQFPGAMEDDQIGVAIRKNFPELQQSVPSQIGNATVRGATGVAATTLRGAGVMAEDMRTRENQFIPTTEAYKAATPEERQIMRNRVISDPSVPMPRKSEFVRQFDLVEEGEAIPERQQVDLRNNPLARAGAAVDRFGNSYRLDPEKADAWYNQVAQGVGSTAAMLVSGVVGLPAGAAGMRVATWVAAGAAGAGEAADRALRAGADEASVIRAAYSGLIPGTLDALSIDNMLRPIHANPGVRGVLYAIAKKALEQAGVEGTTEAIQQVMQNAIARGIYQPNQPLTEDVVQNFLVGAAVGGMFGAGAATMPGQRNPPPAAVPPPAAPGAPGATIPVPPGPAPVPGAPGAPQAGAPPVPPPAPAPAPQAAPAAPPAAAATPPAAPAAPPVAPVQPAAPPAPPVPTPAEQAATELRDILADPRPAGEIAAAQAQEREQQLAAAAADRGLEVDQQVRLTFEDGTDEGVVRRVYWSEDGEPSVTITRPITNSRGRPDELRVYDGPIAGIGAVDRVQGDGSVRDPRVVQTAADLDQVRPQVQQPTPAQSEAGNYRMAHLKLHGMDIAIETVKGGTRTAKDGSWEVTNFPADYGYVKAGKGADGDKIDVYVGPSPESQRVFAIDQIDPVTKKFDEHKIMLGFPDEETALNAYMDAFSDGSGPSRIGSVTGMSVRQLQSWLANEDTRQPMNYTNPTPEVDYGTPEAPAVVPIAQAIAKEIAGGRVFKTIVQARQFVRGLLGSTAIPAQSLKAVDEAIELAYVLRARDVVAQGRGDHQDIYRELTKLYLEQPNLTQTTSTSKMTQAFSTPLPLAYLASRLARIDANATVFEPTAGNGALLIEATPTNVDANEIQGSRAKALELQGFNVTSTDAVNARWESGTRDVVIMNPPFGKVPDGSRVNMGEGYVTNQIDHIIALRALEAMKPDGSAVLLIGSVSAIGDKARADSYRGRAKTEFFMRLRELYNVVDIFTVDGDLYSRQGAAWPVDVVVIRGRGQSARALPSVDVPRVHSSWAELGGLLDASYPERPANVGAPAEPDAGSRDDGGNAGNQPQQGGLPAPDRKPAGPRAGGGGRSGRGGGSAGTQAGAGGPAGGNAAGPAGSEGSAPPVPEPAAPTGDQPSAEPGPDRGGQEPAGGQTTPGGERPVRVGGRPDTEGGGGLNFDALLDDVAGEGQAPTPPAPAAGEPTVTENSVDAAYDDLAKIFGEKQSREDEYERAKPLLERVITPLLQKGMNLAEAFKEMVRVVAQRLNQTVQDIAARMRATLVRFGGAVQSGEVKIPGYAPGKPSLVAPTPTPQESSTKKQDAAPIDDEDQFLRDDFLRRLADYVRASEEMGRSGDDIPPTSVRDAYDHASEALVETARLIGFGSSLEDGVRRIDTPADVRNAIGASRYDALVEKVMSGVVVKPKPPPAKTQGAPPKTNEVAETKYQVAYQPRSGTAAVGTLAPVNMATAMQVALADLDARMINRGGIDGFVASELGYDVSELGNYFSAEQIDAIALAIHHISDRAGFVIGDQCVSGDTLIRDPIAGTTLSIRDRAEAGDPIHVLSLTRDGWMATPASAPFRKGRADLFRVAFDDGASITVTAGHRFLTPAGWRCLRDGLDVGDALVSETSSPDVLSLDSVVSSLQPGEDVGGHRSTSEVQGYGSGCRTDRRSCDAQLLSTEDGVQDVWPSQADAHAHSRCYSPSDDLASSPANIRPNLSTGRRARSDCSPSESRDPSRSASQAPASFSPESPTIPLGLSPSLHGSSALHREGGEAVGDLLAATDRRSSASASVDHTGLRLIVSIDTAGVADFYDMKVPGALNYVAGGVVNHNTGIGKGRVNAAMIRWAVRNGRIPIFITEKPNLYADMLRDLSDIDTGSFTPWITNSDLRGDSAVTFEGRKIETKAGRVWNQQMREIAESQRLPEGYEGVFTTYDQMRMKNGEPNARTFMLGQLAPNAMLILDESHNAGGSGQPVMVDSKTGRMKQTVAHYMRRIVSNAAGVFYSSATWAKRPDVMDLYSSTDLRLAAASPAALKSAFGYGGVPLQQVASSMLARAGQYVRRERSFDGVEFASKPVVVDKVAAENVASAMATIADLDPIIEAIRDKVDTDVKAEGAAVAADAAVGSAGADAISFVGLMHNIVDQSLLALSASPVTAEAIARAKDGEKVVIAVSNTMGSMIGEYAEQNDIRPGQPIDIRFQDLLLRYLERIRWLVVRRPFQKGSKRVYITDEMLGKRGAQLFAEAKAEISAMDIDIPLSPVDLITRDLRRAGLKVGEITGRSNILDLSSDDGPAIYKLRTERERSKAQVNRTVKAFQDGEIDVVIINRSGATGLSMHADGKRAKDLRPRRMIIAQPEKNVDTFMQMLGRIHRTGQVVLPRYSLMIADVPSVIRPSAVLMKKMRSLNANTTASAKSHITDIDVPDFFNEYGDKIAAQLMNEEPDLWDRLRRPSLASGKAGFAPDNAMAKVTGRIPLLPLAEQEEIYDRLQSEYQGYMEQVEQMGLNALEAKTLDLDAKVIETIPFLPGVPGVTSPFAAPAVFTRVDMKSLYRPPPGERVRADVAKAVGAPEGSSAMAIAAAGRDKAEELGNKLRDSVREYTTSALEKETNPERRTNVERTIEAMHRRVDHLLTRAPAGATVRLRTDEGNLYGVVVRVARRGKAKNPTAPGAWRWTIQTTQYRAEIPGSQLYGPDHHESAQDIPGAILIEPVARGQLPEGMADGYAIFDRMQAGGREKRWLITGNVFAGYVSRSQGQIINYTDSDGVLHNGVLMPRDFNAREVAEATPVGFPSLELAVAYLRARNDVSLQTTDAVMEVRHDSGEWTFSVSKVRSVGGPYFLNDDILRAAFPQEFIGSRGDKSMTLKVIGDQGVSVLEAALKSNSVGLQAAKNRDDARSFLRDRGVGTETDSKEKESREPQLTLKPEVRAKADMAKLRAELDRLNLKDVQLVEGAGTGAAGGFIDGLVPIIRIAMDKAKDPLGTLHHEALHAIRALGLLSRKEWSVLEHMARKKWMAQFNIEKRYGDLPAQAQLEEAIADGLRYAAANQPRGVVARTIALIKKLIEATRNWMRGAGFTSSADVFTEIMSGRVGARQRIDQRGVAQQEKFALNPQTEQRIDRVMRSGEPRPIRERLYDLWNSIRNFNRATIYQGMIDGLAAIEKLERGVTGGRLLDALVSPYKKSLAASNLHAYLRTALQSGPLSYDPATGEMGVVQSIPGLTQILSPLSTPERLKAFMGYAIGLRAERLMAEGRENLLTPAEIAEFKALAQQPEFNDFVSIHQQWVAFNSAILDMAEAAGLINAEQRQTWENSDYVPFYRVLDKDWSPGPTDKAGIEGQRSMIRQLRGGEQQINDLLENMVRNTAHLIDASLKNIAMQAVVRFAPGLGIMQRERMAWQTALIPTREAMRRLAAAGVPMPTGRVPNKLLQMFSMVPPSDPDVVSVMIDGKPQFYRVLDPALLASLKGFDHSQLRGLANVLAKPTAVLRRGVTLSPDFMARNAARDSLAAWALSGEKITPFISSLRGFIAYYRRPDIVEEMRAQGVSAGFYNRSSENLARMIRREIEGTSARSGVGRFLVHNAQIAWEFYQGIGEASEMMNRIAVYEAAKARGASKAEAAYQARDLLNFWRSGGSNLARGAAYAYPFFNARLQGLDKMYRAFKQDPRRGTLYAGIKVSSFVFGRAMLLSAMSIALAWLQKDDERYRELQEWDKNAYYHLFLPKGFKDLVGFDHLTFPKPFELGVLFSSIPERIYHAAWTDGGDLGGREWRNAAKQAGKMIADNLSLGMIPMPTNSFAENVIGMMPQVAKPAVEVAANMSAFLQRPIENRSMQNVATAERDNPWTYETARKVARLTEPAIGMSPAQVEYLIRGYLGTMATYAMATSDAIMRTIGDYPTQPSTSMDRMPVVGSFARGDAPRDTKYMNEVYQAAGEARQLAATLRKLEGEQRSDEAEKLRKKEAATLASRPQLERAVREISAIGKEIRQIYTDRTITDPALKRRRIDELVKKRNQIAREAGVVIKDIDRARRAGR